MRYVPDTNALIYLLDNRLAQPFPSGQYGYSVITEIELLSWPNMQPQTEGSCRDLLATMHTASNSMRPSAKPPSPCAANIA